MTTAIEALTDKEILDRLRKAEMADRVERSDEWGILREACKRMHDKGLKMLMTVNPSDQRRIMEIQIMCQFYENILSTVIERFKQDAEAVFQDAVDTGLVQLPPESGSSTP